VRIFRWHALLLPQVLGNTVGCIREKSCVPACHTYDFAGRQLLAVTLDWVILSILEAGWLFHQRGQTPPVILAKSPTSRATSKSASEGAAVSDWMTLACALG